MSSAVDEAQVMDAFFGAPGPDPEIVAKARALQPLIREFAQQGEDDRRVAEEVIVAMKEAGLLHISIPRRWGGYGANFRTFIDTVAEVARADGATGWVSALLNSSTWFVTLFSDQAQEDVERELGPRGEASIRPDLDRHVVIIEVTGVSHRALTATLAGRCRGDPPSR